MFKILTSKQQMQQSISNRERPQAILNNNLENFDFVSQLTLKTVSKQIESVKSKITIEEYRLRNLEKATFSCDQLKLINGNFILNKFLP